MTPADGITRKRVRQVRVLACLQWWVLHRQELRVRGTIKEALCALLGGISSPLGALRRRRWRRSRGRSEGAAVAHISV